MYQPNQTTKYQVLQKIGWLKGSNGTGNVYLLQGPSGDFVLGMKWILEDGTEKFHGLSVKDFGESQQKFSAGLLVSSFRTTNPEDIGFIDVENPEKYERIFEPKSNTTPAPTPTTPTPEPTRPTLPNLDEDVEIPFTISGTIKLGDLSGDLAAILNAFLKQ